MTSTKKICVCGKNRGKEPVIITITTCRNKHSFKVTRQGQIEELPPLLATSSPTDVRKSIESSKSPNKSIEEGPNESTEDHNNKTTANGSIKTQNSFKVTGQGQVEELPTPLATSSPTDARKSIESSKSPKKSIEESPNETIEDQNNKTTANGSIKTQNSFKVTEQEQIEELPTPLATSSPTDVRKSIESSKSPKKSIEESSNETIEDQNNKTTANGSIKTLDSNEKYKTASKDTTNSKYESAQDISTNSKHDPENETVQDIGSITTSSKHEATEDISSAVDDTNNTKYETAQDISSYVTAEETNLEESEVENVNDTTVETDSKSPDSTEGYDADDSSNAEESKDVFFVTETEVNTLPYLGPLLNVVNSKLKKENIQDICGMEIYIFEKHVKDCKHKSFDEKNPEAMIIDNTKMYKLMGKMMFPLSDKQFTKLSYKTVDKFTEAHLEPNGERYIPNLGEIIKSTNNKLSEQLQKQKLVKSLNSLAKNSKTFKKDQNKYLLASDDDDDDSYYSLNNNKPQEISEKNTRDQGSQFEYHFIEIRRSKRWYHAFLECWGRKQRDITNPRYLISQGSDVFALRRIERNSNDIQNYLVL